MEVKSDLLEMANADVEVSELILGTTNDELKQNLAAYHTQQAIEKAIKQLLINKRGYGNVEHDLGQLVADAKAESINIPEWIEENAYEISRWATTIRYNTNFKTNRDSICKYNKLIKDWIKNDNKEEVKKEECGK